MLRVTVGAGSPAATDADALALPFRREADGPVLLAGVDAARELFGGADVLEVVRRAPAPTGPAGPAGECHAVPRLTGTGPRTVFLINVGGGAPAELRRAAAAAVRRARDAAVLAHVLPAGTDPAGAAAVAEASVLAAYRFSAAADPKPPTLHTVDLLGAEGAEQAVSRALAVARAVTVCRDLVNTPSLTKTPHWLAERAGALAGPAGLSVKIRDVAALAAEGFGGVLAVGSGSTRPPVLIELGYTPAGDDAATAPHIVLVGKGITFDSGGLSLKPTDSMVGMKTDMAGGAAVIATMSALAELGVPARVTGLVPAAENMPSGSAQRPSDVIRHYDGRTVEVLNTDAEGRLVLADALAYADACLAPDIVVDLATLTGAATRGLGRRHAALFTDDDGLAAELLAAGEAAGERLWRMPLVAEYRRALDSPVADLANVAAPGSNVSAGAIVAALFLREFTGGRRWAHLDIAGPARADAEEHEVSKGGTGFGVRTLLRWLAGPAAPAQAGG